jgi:uncharacterized protein (UPF0333 family)
MENKGQASAEYLLLIVVILIILAAVTVPLVGSSVNATMDVSKSSDTKNAVESIANAVNIVYANGPGAKRTITIYIPETSTLTSMNAVGGNVSNKVIGMGVLLSNGTTKYVNASTDYNTTITNPSLTGKTWYNVTITWAVGSNFITVTPTG